MNLYKIRGSLKYQYEGINIFIIDNILRFFTPDLEIIPYKTELWVNEDINISHISYIDNTRIRIFFREYPQIIFFNNKLEFNRKNGRFYFIKKGLYTYRVPFTIREMISQVSLEKLRIFGDLLIDDIRFVIFSKFLKLCRDDMDSYEEIYV